MPKQGGHVKTVRLDHMITSRQPSSLFLFTLKLTGNHHRTTCISSRPQLCGQVSKFKDKKKKLKESQGIIGRMECKDRNLKTLIECDESKIKGQKWLQTIFKFSFHFFSSFNQGQNNKRNRENAKKKKIALLQDNELQKYKDD